MTEENMKAIDDVFAADGPTAGCWEYFARWLLEWRAEYPEDGRTDLELLGVFSEEA